MPSSRLRHLDRSRRFLSLPSLGAYPPQYLPARSPSEKPGSFSFFVSDADESDTVVTSTNAVERPGATKNTAVATAHEYEFAELRLIHQVVNRHRCCTAMNPAKQKHTTLVVACP